MPTHKRAFASSSKAVAAAATTLLLLTACSTENVPAYPDAHIHGMTVEDGGERILLATHDGLYDMSAEPIKLVSPPIDLMGFSDTAEDGLYYASGHPGPGSELPNPVGLIQSRDGGRTWEPLSRQGESDFHALTVFNDGLIGYDGNLMRSSNGENWTTSTSPIQPVDLSGSPDGPVVLATTEQGLQRSEDGGKTFSAVEDAPLLYLTAFADPSTAVGVAPDGTVHVSEDSGASWERSGEVDLTPNAIIARTGDEGLRIWIAGEENIQFSADSGETFSTWRPE